MTNERVLINAIICMLAKTELIGEDDEKIDSIAYLINLWAKKAESENDDTMDEEQEKDLGLIQSIAEIIAGDQGGESFDKLIMIEFSFFLWMRECFDEDAIKGHIAEWDEKFGSSIEGTK